MESIFQGHFKKGGLRADMNSPVSYDKAPQNLSPRFSLHSFIWDRPDKFLHNTSTKPMHWRKTNRVYLAYNNFL